MDVNPALYAFNRGVIDDLALARADLKRLALSAEIQRNFIPHSLGPMSLRPGAQYIGASKSNAQAYSIPFRYSANDTAIIELTPTVARFWIDDELLTRPSVSTAITNGTFTSNITTGWTDVSDAAATAQWVTGGYLGLTGSPSATAALRQTLSVSSGDSAVLHALRIIIERGFVTIRVGTTAGGNEVLLAENLSRGYHDIAFTPGATTVYLQVESNTEYETLLDQCGMSASGTVELTVPWSASELPTLRYSQSGDVVYVGSGDLVTRFPRVFERRANNSWSVILYIPEDGPFESENTSGVTVAASATRGDVTLTASASLFDSTRVGALLQIRSTQQLVTGSLSALDATTDYIEVQGTGNTRQWTLTLSGTWTATVVLERAIGSPDVWQTVTSYTTTYSDTIDDGLTNQLVYYRLRVSAYTSGTVSATLDYPNGSITGTCRIVAVASATSATAIVLIPFGGTSATKLWSWGSWGVYRGWPKTPLVTEGRLWWFGRGSVWASVSDSFLSFDADIEGDSAPIKRVLGEGATDKIQWAVALQRIVAGGEGAELSVRSSGDNEAITASNVNVKASSTQGSADVQAVHIDGGAVFLQRSNRRIFELAYQIEPNDYASTDLSLHAPVVTQSGIVRMAVQRQPDTRLHCVRADGRVAILLFNKAEEIICWVEYETDGLVEDVCVLPGDAEDRVYYWVKRTVNGSTVRYLEKWALQDDCMPFSTIYRGSLSTTISGLEYVDGTVLTVRDENGTKVENVTVSARVATLSAPRTFALLTPANCRLGDSHVVYSGAATTTITGLTHLEGESVVVWGDGAEQGTFTVSGGQVTGLSESVEEACVGLVYDAVFKSAKLAYGDTKGTALAQPGKIGEVGLLLARTHHSGVTFGRDLDNLNALPQDHEGATVIPSMVYKSKDVDMMSFGGTYDADPRLFIKASAPRPCTVLAAVLSLSRYD